VVLVEKDNGQVASALARLADFVNQDTLEEGYDKQAWRRRLKFPAKY
jgi:hypothetical protein